MCPFRFLADRLVAAASLMPRPLAVTSAQLPAWTGCETATKAPIAPTAAQAISNLLRIIVVPPGSFSGGVTPPPADYATFGAHCLALRCRGAGEPAGLHIFVWSKISGQKPC